MMQNQAMFDAFLIGFVVVYLKNKIFSNSQRAAKQIVLLNVAANARNLFYTIH